MKDYEDEVEYVIHKALKRAGGKKKNLAKAINVRPQTVAAWFTGTIPRGETMARLVHYLKRCR